MAARQTKIDHKQKIIEEAEKNPDFLAALQVDPKAAIHEFFNVAPDDRIPENVTVRVVVDTPTTVFINVFPVDDRKFGGY